MRHRLQAVTPSPTDRSELGIRTRVRFQSVSSPSACRPFTTMLNPDQGTRVQPEVWVTMTELRLGNRLYNGTQQFPSCCSSAARHGARHSRSRPIPLLDAYGHHATVCSCEDGSTRRHNALRNGLFKLLGHRYSINAQTEWRPQDAHKPEAEQRRIDIYIDEPSFAPTQTFTIPAPSS